MPETTTPKDYIFGLATYLLMSARGCVDEPKMYGPLRLVDAISRLAMIPEYAQCVERDDFLTNVKAKIEQNEHLVMDSEDDFVKFLDQLAKEFTTELKRRNGIQ